MKIWFSEKINKIDKTLRKKKRTKINTIRNERGETTTDTTEVQRIVRNYCEELYAKECENLDEMDKFWEKYNFPKLNEEETESLNRPITPDEIETVIKNSQHRKTLDQMVSQENSTEYLRES